MENQVACLNCGVEVKSNFCPSCGQKTNLTPIRMKDIGSDFISSFVNYDGPFPKSFALLLYNPGKLVREYLEGQRKKYFSPVRYLLVALAFSVLIVELFDYDPVLVQMRASGRTLSVVNNPWSEAGRFLHQHINFFIFLFPFSVGVITKLFYWKEKYVFAERTVLGFYLAAQFLFISSIMIPIITYYPKIFNFITLIILSFLSFAFFSFFKQKIKWLGVIKAIFTSLFSFIIYVFIGFIIAYFIVRFKS